MGKKHRRQPPETTAKSRQLRREATLPERIVWAVLRNGRLAGLKFRRQHPVGPFVVDFYCHEARLVVEIDGLSHEDRLEADQRRTEYLNAAGLRVFRITNDDVLEDAEAVARGIAQAAGASWA